MLNFHRIIHNNPATKRYKHFYINPPYELLASDQNPTRLTYQTWELVLKLLGDKTTQRAMNAVSKNQSQPLIDSTSRP